MARPAGPPRDNEAIRDISEAVYRMKLKDDGVRSMIRKHGEADGNSAIRRNAASYDNTTVCYLIALGIPIPTLEHAERETTEGLFAE